jgi:hypothetical protein
MVRRGLIPETLSFNKQTSSPGTTGISQRTWRMDPLISTLQSPGPIKPGNENNHNDQGIERRRPTEVPRGDGFITGQFTVLFSRCRAATDIR